MPSVMEIAMKEMGRLIELANANLKVLPGPIVNVGGYGAVGDGTTDDTQSVQNAIDYAVANGMKAIFFPHGSTGEYKVTALTDDDQVIFFGDNASFTGGYVSTINQFGDSVSHGDLDDLAGAGRTTETVKGNADDLTAHKAEFTQLKSDTTNDRTDSLVVTGSGVEPASLNFYQRKIDRTQNMQLPVYDNNFEYDPNTDEVDELTQYNTGANVRYTHSAGKITLDVNATTGTFTFEEIYLSTGAKFEIPNFVVEMDVLQDHNAVDGTGSTQFVGIIKDIDNYVKANYDYYNSLMQVVVKVGGVATSTSFTFSPFTAPYTMVFLVQNKLVIMAIKKDNVYTKIGEANIGSTTNLTDKAILNQYSAFFGFRGNKGTGAVEVSGFRAGYTSGMSFGSDYKAITYEDGNPIQNGNAIYFTATPHSTASITGASGATVYKLDLCSYKVEFVGVICFKVASGTAVFGGGSSKVFYDRNNREFVVQTGDFIASPNKAYIGKTKANLLSGINIVDVQEMDIPDKTIACWDIDIIYKDDGLYHAVYSKAPSGGITHVTAADVLGTWTLVQYNSDGGEGCCFFKADGQYFISKTDLTDTGLDVYDLDTLTKQCTLSFDRWCNKAGHTPLSWGQILTINKGDTTAFYAIVFSGRIWGSGQYAYGDLWIYQASETEDGIEFSEQNVLKF